MRLHCLFVAAGCGRDVLLGDLGGFVRELVAQRVKQAVEWEAHVAQDRTERHHVAHDLDAPDLVDDVSERHWHEADVVSASQVDGVGRDVVRVEDDGAAGRQLAEVQGDCRRVERDQNVGRHDVAEDLVLADAKVVGVVAAFDERRVLGEVEGVVAGAGEDARKRLTCGFDTETGGTADPDANLASVRCGLEHRETS